jgi:cysteine-rich repeat protein
VSLALAVAFGTAEAAAPSFPGAVTTTFVSPVDALPVPDNDSLVSVIDVPPLAGTVFDVDVALDLAHPQPDQLDVYLVSPSGTTVTLTTDNGAGNDDVFAGAVFDDQASGTPSAPNVRNFVYTNAVPTGAIQPEEPLGAVIGETAEGSWALVVVDDTGGQTGTLRGWSLSITTVPGILPGAPAVFQGGGGSIPDNNATGRSSSVVVSGVGTHLYDVDVTVDVTHPRSGDVDLFLTSPSGRRIDLVTGLGGAQASIWQGATFDDQAGVVASDAPLPTPGSSFARVSGEGALSAFVGEDPNGTWTLLAADHRAGNTGTLNGWTLRVVTATACGDGVVDPGEQCDDGNTVDGDGCDANCKPSTEFTTEVDCGNCVDDDQNGLVDAADPACAAHAFSPRRASLTRGAHGRLALDAALPLGKAPSGAVGLVLSDANGTVTCATLGPLRARGKTFSARGRAGAGVVTVTLARGKLRVSGHGLDLSSLDDPTVSLGLTLGSDRFLGRGTFRSRGRRWTMP